MGLRDFARGILESLAESRRKGDAVSARLKEFTQIQRPLEGGPPVRMDPEQRTAQDGIISERQYAANSIMNLENNRREQSRQPSTTLESGD